MTEGNLRRTVSQTLVGEGFTRGGRMHLKRIDQDFSMVVDTGTLDRHMDISPWVGIRSEQVENLMTEMRKLPPYAYAGTVAANVGYIVDGQYQSWMPPAQASEVVGAIHLALRRLTPYCSIAGVAEAWDQFPAAAADPSTAYRKVIVRVLLNDADGAAAELMNAEAEYCKRPDQICVGFRAFKEETLIRLGIR